MCLRCKSAKQKVRPHALQTITTLGTVGRRGIVVVCVSDFAVTDKLGGEKLELRLESLQGQAMWCLKAVRRVARAI